jgi:hypothetical protein
MHMLSTSGCAHSRNRGAVLPIFEEKPVKNSALLRSSFAVAERGRGSYSEQALIDHPGTTH